jgi:hypothetical protein
MTIMTRRTLGASAVALFFAASFAAAQAPQMVRVRATLEDVSVPMLTAKSRDGAEMKIKLADNAPVNEVVKASLSDIKDNSYIAVTAMPQPDGSQKAIAIHIFMESQRGAAEGFRPWDLRPNSTMTNATVAQTVASVDGQVIEVKYKDGEKKVVVPPDAAIVAFAAGDKAEVKPGAKIIIFGAVKKDDGSLETNRIGVGRDGIAPPM